MPNTAIESCEWCRKSVGHRFPGCLTPRSSRTQYTRMSKLRSSPSPVFQCCSRVLSGTPGEAGFSKSKRLYSQNQVGLQEKRVCQETRTKEPQSSTISPRTHTVLLRRTTAKKIIRLGMNIPDKPWNIPPRLTSSPRKLIGNQKAPLTKSKEGRNRRPGLRVRK